MAHLTSSAILNSLARIFPGEPLFLTDSDELYRLLRTADLRCHRLSPRLSEKLPAQEFENVVLLFTTFDYFAWPFLEYHFKSSRLFMVPLVSFDPSLEAAIYTLNRIGEANFVSSTFENKNILEFLASTTEPFQVVGSGCRLHCELSDKLRLMRPKTEAALLPGEWEAVGMWFETAMVPDEEDVFHPGHIVSGTVCD